MKHQTATFASISISATDTLGDPVRTCRPCRDDGDGARIACEIAVGEWGAFGSCERPGHDGRAIARSAGSSSTVTLVTLTTPDGTPCREAFATN